MSAYSTSSPSIEQTLLYLIRPPSAACTWLKRMSLSSVAEYSFTPMLTNPKETAPFQIDRMLPAPVRPAPVKIVRIGGSGLLRQVGRRPDALAGDPRACSAAGGQPARGVGHGGVVGRVVLARGECAVLDGVVDELQDVGARDHGHGQRGQPGRPG